MKIRCRLCKGSGRDFRFPRSELCPVCKGERELTIQGNPTLHDCPICDGTGRDFRLPRSEMCEKCNGITFLTEDGTPPRTLREPARLPLEPVPPSNPNVVIAPTRIKELQALKSPTLDFQRLIRLCEELNTAYSQGCYFATIMLTRSVLDHVPPVFGKNAFTEVVNNHSGGKSFSDGMRHLDDGARKIADAHLHTPMRAQETLPTPQQVNFGQLLDMLLGEIVRISR